MAGVDIGNAIDFGSNSVVSLMEMTIFSRSTGVMCFSRPLLLLSQESAHRSSGRAFGIMVALAGGDDDSSSSLSSDNVESRLEDSSGTGMSVVAAFGFREIEMGGEAVERACDSALQQKVSRFHNRQLKFSNRLPSSIACDVFENNDHCDECEQAFIHMSERRVN